MDADIINKAISGDTEALTMLINSYKDIAYNLALTMVKNKENAKDIVQDSFLRVLENIGKFRNDSGFSTWLYRIVYNESLAFLKRNKITYCAYVCIPSAEHGYYDRIGKNDYDLLYKSIEDLDDPEKSVMVLFYLAEKSLKEIKEITGYGISNIKVILHRARKKLQQKMKPEYESI